MAINCRRVSDDFESAHDFGWVISEYVGHYRLRKNSCFVSGHDFHSTPGQVRRAENRAPDEGFRVWAVALPPGPEFFSRSLDPVRKAFFRGL
jgi:hypothetical protein